jgi:hypothetical protein
MEFWFEHAPMGDDAQAVRESRLLYGYSRTGTCFLTAS